jgi:hypothetical protein
VSNAIIIFKGGKVNILTKSALGKRKYLLVIMLIIVIAMITTTTSVLAWKPPGNARWGGVNPLYYYINCESPSSTVWSLSASTWNNAGTPAHFTSNIMFYKVYLSAYASAPGGWDGVTYDTLKVY